MDPKPSNPNHNPDPNAAQRPNASQQKNLAGKPVTVVRDARAGDPGFDAGKPGQVVVRTANGEEKVVASSDLT